VWSTIAKPNTAIAMSKSKLVAAVAVLSLTGCAYHNITPPVDVRLVPNDCANRRMIENYLTQQAQQPRQLFESEKDYEIHRSEIRMRVWTVRYHCNPV
jgi:hypothetical protein